MKWTMTWPTMRAIWVAAMGITMIGGAAAWWQWYIYQGLVQELSSLHALYQVFPEILLYHDACETCDEEVDPSFIVINRDSTYLSEQAQAFIQQSLPQRMRSFMQQERRSKRSNQRSPRKHRQQSSAWLDVPLKRGTFWISSLFGPRKQPSGKYGYHYGVDFAAERGTPVYACADGKVVYAGWYGGFGNVVVISHDNGFKTRYAHLHTIHVRPRDHVTRGARVGAVGDTGNVRKTGRDASHLHLEVEEHGKRKNPLYYLKVGNV